jgi:hypothetical protein
LEERELPRVLLPVLRVLLEDAPRPVAEDPERFVVVLPPLELDEVVFFPARLVVLRLRPLD